MKEKKSNIGKYLLILVPFVMGVTGFTVLDGQPVVDSLFLSMEMYFLNYSDSPPNYFSRSAVQTEGGNNQ